MYKNTLCRILLILLLFAPLFGSKTFAQLTTLEVGKVYHFTNVNYTAKALAATTPTTTAGVTADDGNKSQLWYVEKSQQKDGVTYYALRNLGYGTYLQGNGQSAAWTLANTTDSDKSWFALTAVNGNTAIRSYNERNDNYGFAHIDGSSNVVGWESGASSTQWKVSKMEMSEEDIQAALGIYNNATSYQTTLDDLFSDKACTTLNGTFDANNASFLALPEVLQNMVRKVAGTTSWEENYNNGKDPWGADYAKKYRVQLYEPYNDAGAAASALGLNAHSSLNNPTGIFANNGDVLYVMVDDEIKDGATLYLAYYTGHGKPGGSTQGYELKQGLNIIPVYQNSSNFCVNYVVQTFDTSDGKKGNKAKARKLSEYPPIKIHIEGGYINGYYNKVGDDLYPADKNANWDYIEARATQTDVTVLGKYVTLQFPLLDENTVDGNNNMNKGLASIFNDLVEVEKSIDEWDNVMLWERLLLGVLGESTIQEEAKTSPYAIDNTKKVFEYTGGDGEFESDYSDYYNIHGLSYGTPTGYMYGGWDHCGYNYNTMEAIMVNMTKESGPHWGPGHEIGHQHQNLLTVNGLTEVTNNLFANVVLWYFGESTSRYNGTEGALSNVLKQFNAEGTDFFSNNIWAQTIMYYKLFLYYHVLGHNPKFYPRLFEMLRQDPMSTGYNQDGSKCLMHFYKKCCLAAGEDLTEFFRAHGFFEVMNNRLVGDYSNSVYTLTQAQIDAAIKEVKDLDYEENLAVLFITDATGETIKSHKGDNLDLYGETTVCAEVGCYANFNEEAANYTYSISGTTVTMEGTGGVGFAIFNDKGELIGFSDKKAFEISAEAAAAIASGEASIVTLKGDNTQVATTNVMDAGDNETKYELLGNLLNDAKAVLDLSDETGKKVGYYRTSALTDLQTAYNTAKEVYDAKTVAAYSSVYDVLFQEYANLINNEYARINITEGYAYRLTNKAYPGRSMAVATSGDDANEMFGLETADNDAQLWYLEPGTTKGTYYLKNKSTSLYPAGASTGAVLSANKDESTKGKDGGAAPYTLQDLGGGVFALINGPALHCSSSQSYNIVGWGADAEASQWTITAVALDEALEARTKLEELVGKAEALINEVGTVEEQGVEPITLTADAYYCNARCINTQWDKFSSYSVLNDGDIDTYLHTDYSGEDSEDGYAHYIRMDVGESNNVQMFKINYTTRNYTYPTAPTSITVEGSNDLTTWEPIETNFTEGLPTNQGTAFTTPAFGNGIKYRYIRLVVNSTSTNKEAGPEGNKHRYFALSELGISKVNYTTALNATYNTINSNLLSDLYSGMLEANGTLATSSQADVLNAAYTTLYTTYKALLDAKAGVDNTALTAKKATLQELIDDANTLIAECGSVEYTEETTPQLNVTAAPYLLSDNNGASEGSLDKLYDGQQGKNNSYTSSWGDAPTDASYLQVDLGTGKELEELIFTFTNRTEGNAPTPTEIVVSASADGNNFTTLTTFTSEEANWPPAANNQSIAATKWTSPVIEATSACRYWRFTVTKSQRNTGGETNNNGVYHFGISEFGIVIPASCNVTVNEGMGEVDEALMLETYHEVAEAQSVQTYATTEAQLDKAIAQLQAQHDALLEAKNNQYAQDLQVKIDETEALIAECGRIENGEVVEVFESAGDVTKQQLLDAYNQVAVAQGLIDAGGATQEQYENATTALETLRDALTTAKDGTVRSTLRTLTDNVAELITLCGTTPGDVSEVMLNDLTTANQEALELLQGDQLTAIAEKTTALQELYNTVSTAQKSDTKTPLRDLIEAMETLINGCTTGEGESVEYVGDVTEDLLYTSTQAKEAAQDVINANNTTTADFTEATETLQGYYNTLLVAKNSTAKADLRAMISKLEELIEKCRITVTNTVTRTEECDLQTNNSEESFYLSTNAGTKEGSSIANLVDNNTDTYFQTARNDNGEQYLLVDAGADNSLKKFRFSYRTKMSPFPYMIKVYGSNNNLDFNELATFENLPVSTDQLWTSTDISNGTAYRYLRFNIVVSKVALKVDEDEVDTSNGEQYTNKFKNPLYTAAQQGSYCFAMSEFNLVNIVDEEQETEILVGTVTEDQLTEATDANTAAEKLANESADSEALRTKKDSLQVIYDAIYAAYGIQVSLATTVEDRDQLLSNIDWGSTIGTFSAQYPTVIPEGVTAYYAEQATEGGTISLTAIESGVIPANEGVILIGSSGNNTVMMLPATSEEIPTITNVFANSATGPVTMGESDYILANSGQGIGFYNATFNSILKQGKAYLHFDNPQQAKSLVLNFGGVSTGMETTRDPQTSEQMKIYDLAGRLVSNVKKGGIYIKNGQKFIVK